MTKKDQQIIESTEKTGEPIFVIRAKDEMSVETLQSYLASCAIDGCTPAHLGGIQARIHEFVTWQAANPDKVKKPD